MVVAFVVCLHVCSFVRLFESVAVCLCVSVFVCSILCLRRCCNVSLLARLVLCLFAGVFVRSFVGLFDWFFVCVIKSLFG